MATDPQLREVLETLIKAQQGNADHILGEVREVAKQFNKLANDVGYLYDALGIQYDTSGTDDSEPGSASALVKSHSELEGVTSDQHHAKLHNIHDRAHHSGALWPPGMYYGSSGEEGAAGPPGKRGATGATGATGAAGADGAAGARGRAGVPGFPGTDGSDFGMWVPPTRGGGSTPGVDSLDDLTDVDPNVIFANDGDIFYWSDALNAWSYTPATTFLSTNSETARLFIPSSVMELDDATRGNVGTTPDLVGDVVFADAVRQGVYFSTHVPRDWQSGSAMTFGVVWRTNTSTGNMVLTLSASELASGDAATEVSSYATENLIVADGTAVKYSTWATTFTPATAGNLLKFNLERLGANASDTATGNAQVLGFYIDYTAVRVTGPRGEDGAPGMPSANYNPEEQNHFGMWVPPRSSAQTVASELSGDGAYRRSLKKGTQAWWFDDFLFSSSGMPYLLFGTTGASAASGPLATAVETTHPGVISLSTGTTSSGAAQGRQVVSPNNILPGGGVIRFGYWVKTPAQISDVTNTYTLKVGACDTQLNATIANGWLFTYTHGTNGGRWQAEIDVGSSPTTGDTGVTVLAGTWYFLEIEVNAASTAASFWVNEVFGCTVTATQTSLVNFGGAVIRKNAGTADRAFLYDAMYYQQSFSPER